MSDLYRSTMSARLSKLPQLPAIPDPNIPHDGDEEDEVDGLGELPSRSGAKKDREPGMLPPSSVPSLTTKTKQPKPEFASISASTYFSQALQVEVPARGLDFRVYYSDATSGASSNSLSTSSSFIADTEDPGAVVICHHGAGYSGLSFALFAKEVEAASTSTKASSPVTAMGSWNPTAAPWASEDTSVESGKAKGRPISVLAFDSRGHGKTRSISSLGAEQEMQENPPTESDLSIQTLTTDLEALVCKLFPIPSSSLESKETPKVPSILLLGHSMGGSVVTRVCPLLQSRGYMIEGVIVVDVVEGSALEALPHMNTILSSRPTGFANVEEAVEWHITSKTIRNSTSARVSVPSILVKNPTPPPNGKLNWLWRTPLDGTAPFWKDWFTSLSSLFLSLRTARLLILAGTDRLDKELMIGQMQGKFQCVVLQGVGHVVQEDDPTKLADIIVEFWRKNERLAKVPGVKIKRVGDL